MASNFVTLKFPPPVRGEAPGPYAPTTDLTTAAEVVDFVVDGAALRSRPVGGRQVYSALELSGACPAGDSLFVCDMGELKQLMPNGSVVSHGFVGVGSTLDYVRYNDWLFFVTEADTFRVDASLTPMRLSIPTPSFSITPGVGDEVDIAVTTTVNGLESSPAYASAVREGSVVTGAGFLRVFVLDGGTYRLCGEGASGVTVTSSNLRGACQTLGTAPIGGGQFIAYAGGRLLVADGPHLKLSMPYQPHLRSDAYGLVEFTHAIAAVVALSSSVVAVSDGRGVWLLRLGDPPSLTQVWRGAVVYGAGAPVRASNYPSVQTAGATVATFLVDGGWLIVTEEGVATFIPQEHDISVGRVCVERFGASDAVTVWKIA